MSMDPAKFLHPSKDGNGDTGGAKLKNKLVKSLNTDKNDDSSNTTDNKHDKNILKKVTNTNGSYKSKKPSNLNDILSNNDENNNELTNSPSLKENNQSPRGNNINNIQESPKVISNKFSLFHKGDKNESRRKTELDQVDQRRDELYNGNMSSPSIHQSNNSNTSPYMGNDSSPQSLIPESPTSLRRADPDDYRKLSETDEQSATWLRRMNPFQPKESTHWMDKLFNNKKSKNRETSKPKKYDEEPEQDSSTRERAELLVSTLLAGAPAALIAASRFLQDEHDETRVPLLLPLLGFKLHDETVKPSKNRKYRIELEYGIGPERLKWSVMKSSKELNVLHSKLKLAFFHSNGFRPYKQVKMPEFPRMKWRSKTATRISTNNDNNNNNNNNPGLNNAIDADQQDNESLFSITSTIRGRFQNLTRFSTLSQSDPEYNRKLEDLNQKFEEHRLSMEKYLKELFLLLTLKPQCNRLFHFLGLSPIGVLLSQEHGYQGQQGQLFVASTAKTQGWRVGHLGFVELYEMVSRHTTKWFLVRNSYIVYVSDINSTTPLEVFLVDTNFKVEADKKNPTPATEVFDDESEFDDSSVVAVEDLKRKASHFARAGYGITLENNERKLKMVATSKKEYNLWVDSLSTMQQKTIWSKEQRFDSFAPVRDNCFAQWFVDARDYFWAASSAMEMATDVIYIHDWWLSPELYMRRPALGNQQWRLDRILKRKAEEGVKIFVIVYRNVGTTVSTDSLYTKHSLLDLHENVHVIRSPNQLLQNTYFWAHHEKLLIVDQTIAFIGGIDLCYGRFDTPDHVVVDDSHIDFNEVNDQKRTAKTGPDTEDTVKFQTFPGKDYSNPRVKDFFGLDKPYESMYDRDTTPRMPWHDIHMVSAGQIARDLSRHFVQRWNYLLRQKRPSRPTPLLLPPSDFKEEEIESLGLGGTCEIQLLRSSGQWSLGLKEHEQSIQNAYLKLIETSEHFVYIENQFFITSCAFDGVVIKNRIGDALVDRIIRAHQEGTAWRACIVIPLMPGFESQVDEPDGSSVRVIMQCQFMSISRGTTSIFAKLKRMGIDPDDYIQFFSLRKWGRIGPDRTLVTEQLYVHAKTMIVDDRSVIIGSANINERSMRGVRDSEMAAVVRDNEMVSTTMNGEPYQAGKFAHTLRMRLMREHLGVSVDILDVVERRFKQLEEVAKTPEGLKARTGIFKDPEHRVLSAIVELASRDILNQPEGTNRWKKFQKTLNLKDEALEIPLEAGEDGPNGYSKFPDPHPLPLSFNHRAGQENVGIRVKKTHSSDSRIQNNEAHKDDVNGLGKDKYKSKFFKKARINTSKILREWANKAMNESPSNIFLPEFEQVREILESEDIDFVGGEIDEETESHINDKNKDRLALLKRVAYLQRVAAREKITEEEESKKRVLAGLNPKRNLKPTSSDSAHKNKVTSIIDVPGTDSSEYPAEERKYDTNDANANHPTIPEKKSFDPLTPEDGGDSIPIVSLDEEGVRAVIEPLTPGKVENFSKFIDPYGFEDPLDEEFYEDIWYEHALRNTSLYRLVFHTQPDDAVTTWKEYKEFLKLQGAFHLAQEQEIKFNKMNKENNSDLDEDSFNVDDRRYSMTRNMSHATINFNDINDELQPGILGRVPPNIKINDDNNPLNQRESIIEEEEEEHHNDNNHQNANGNAESPKDSNEKQNLNRNAIHKQRSSNTINGNINTASHSNLNSAQNKQRKRAGTFGTRHKSIYRGVKIFDRETSDRILSEIKGNLVLFPSNWLYKELDGNNWFYNTDRIPPIEIYD